MKRPTGKVKKAFEERSREIKAVKKSKVSEDNVATTLLLMESDVNPMRFEKVAFSINSR